MLIEFAKMARPKKTILKQKTITVHCTNTDYALIKNTASKARLSMSELLLRLGVELKIEARLTQEEIDLFKAIAGMANNLNQIAKRLNNGELLKLKSIEDLERISELLKKFE